MSETIHDILYKWGRSRRSNDAYSLDYPHASPYSKEMRNSGQYAPKLPSLDEDRHCSVDKCVSQLKQKPDHKHEIICMFYVERMPVKLIARRLKRSAQYVNTKREAAENYLEAKLEENSILG